MELTAAAREALRTWPWPGNVRELQNTIERAAILSRGAPTETRHLDGPAGPALRAREGDPGLPGPRPPTPLVAAAKLHPNDHNRTLGALEVFRATGRPLSAMQTQARPALDGTAVFLSRADDDLRTRIAARVRRQVEVGLEAEVRRLMERPWSR